MHQLLSSIFSLFMDEVLMQLGNLIHKNEKKLLKQRKHKGIYGEINTSTAFWKSSKKNKKKLIVPIIIFGDGTVIDGAMQKSLKPFSFTFGIFWQSLWMQTIAWHNLGCIKNNLECLFSAEKMKEGKHNQKDNMIWNKKDPEYVSEPWLEYNAQMWVMMYGLYRLQQLATGMNFHTLAGCIGQAIYFDVSYSVFHG